MKRTLNSMLVSALAIVAPVTAPALAVEIPSHNRSIRAGDIVVRLTDEPGVYTIVVTPWVENRIPGLSDLSILLTTRVGGILIDEQYIPKVLAGGINDGCGGGCARCDLTHSCRSGQLSSGTMYCDCASGGPIAVGPVALPEGVSIEISITAAPGSLAEVQTHDDAASITFTAADAYCIADFDDGSGRGQPDHGVSIEDLLAFLDFFDEGRIQSDVNLDGGLTIEDLLLFLHHFDAGC